MVNDAPRRMQSSMLQNTNIDSVAWFLAHESKDFIGQATIPLRDGKGLGDTGKTVLTGLFFFEGFDLFFSTLE